MIFTPTESTQPTADYEIRDRHGIRYRVESLRDDFGWSFYLHLGDQEAGYLNCLQHPSVLTIGDFKLYDSVPTPETFLPWLRRQLLSQQRPVLNFRGRGLGTAMLALLERLALKAGFHRLDDWISKVDTADNPDLPKWYRRRGFIVVEGPGQYPMQVASISKALGPVAGIQSGLPPKR